MNIIQYEHCHMPSDGPGLRASVAPPGRKMCNNNNHHNVTACLQAKKALHDISDSQVCNAWPSLHHLP